METVSKKSFKSNFGKKSRLVLKEKVCLVVKYAVKALLMWAQHIAAIHEGKKPFKCDTCDYSCSEKGSMKKHVSSVHEGKKSFKCEVCNSSCSEKSNLNQHVALVHEVRKPYV